MIFTDIKLHTLHVAIHVQVFRRQPKKITNLMDFKAPIIRFAQFKFRIVHALHSLCYKRESTKASVVQADS